MRCVWEQRQATAIVERLCFALSNITTSMTSRFHHVNRVNVAHTLCTSTKSRECYTGAEALLSIMEMLAENPVPNAPALVKVIRLLANISTDESTGQSLAESGSIGVLLPILGLKITLIYYLSVNISRFDAANVDVEEVEELVLNAASLVHNLSYYAESPSHMFLPIAQSLIAGTAYIFRLFISSNFFLLTYIVCDMVVLSFI